MPNPHPKSVDPKSYHAVGQRVVRDVSGGGLRRSFRRDMAELYEFYLDEDERLKLASMGRIKGWFFLVFTLFREMLLKMAPLRRLLLLFALVLYIYGELRFEFRQATLDFNFTPASIALLLLVIMLELKDKLLAHDELAVGRAVQLALMPMAPPQIPGWDVWLYTRPANDVGGDMVDWIEVGESRWALALGDVSGKGLGAALLMAKLQATLRAFVPGEGDLAHLGDRLNRILCRDGIAGKFATLAYLEIEAGSDTVRLLNAGHMPPLLRQEGKTTTLPPVAPPLGVVTESVFRGQTVEVNQGDLLLLYSDGLTDAHDAKWEFFGEERLLALLPGLEGLPAEEAGKLILAEVGRFAGDQKPFDDLSLILLRRLSVNG